MTMMQWLLETGLSLLLAITLFHALRLQKALTSLRRDRAALEEMIVGFDENARRAESGIDRLRAMADAAARQVSRQIDQAKTLTNDLAFLSERGERVADQLDRLVRHGQGGFDSAGPQSPALAQIGSAMPATQNGSNDVEIRARSQAERDLMRVLRAAR